MSLQAFALLCALATVSCVAGAARPAQLAYVAYGALAGAVLMLPALLGLPIAPLLAVEPAQVALLLVLCALARLRGDVGPRTALVIGGVLAVVWLQALLGAGWPLFAALPFVALAVVAAAVLGLKKAFFPPALQDEVAVVVLAGGLLVALVPEILGGWNSAQVLQGGSAAATAAGNKVVWIAAGFVVLGAVFAYMKRWSR